MPRSITGIVCGVLARSRAVYPWDFGGHVLQVSTLLSLKACDTQKSPLVLADPLPCPPYLSISRSSPFFIVTIPLSLPLPLPLPLSLSFSCLQAAVLGRHLIKQYLSLSSHKHPSSGRLDAVPSTCLLPCCSLMNPLPPVSSHTHRQQRLRSPLSPPPLPTLRLSPFFAARRQQL